MNNMNNMNRRRNGNQMPNRQMNNNQMNNNQNRQVQSKENTDLAYPIVKVAKPNIAYARMILDNIGGCASEMTAITLYAYNHVIFREYEDVASAFGKVNIVEMRHFDIFSELALQLGENPRLWTQRYSQKVFWSPSCVKYSKHLADALGIAIDEEKAAIKKYESQIEQIQDENVVENLQRIIIDEKQHEETFIRLLEKYSAK